MKKTKGLTFMICFGSYGGFNIQINFGFRIALGWVSFSIIPADIENYLHNELVTKPNK